MAETDAGVQVPPAPEPTRETTMQSAWGRLPWPAQVFLMFATGGGMSLGVGSGVSWMSANEVHDALEAHEQLEGHSDLIHRIESLESEVASLRVADAGFEDEVDELSDEVDVVSFNVFLLCQKQGLDCRQK